MAIDCNLNHIPAGADLGVSRWADVYDLGCLAAGSTLIAAEEIARVCCGAEENPHSLDAAIRRLQRKTGKCAIDLITGESFDERAQQITRLTRRELDHGK
jgi:hypothetical protein